MRKLLIPALCVLLALCSVLSGCRKKQTPPEEENLPAAPSGEKGKDTTYTLTEHYLPETVSAAMKTAITEEPLAFTGADMSRSYYVIDDVFALSDCRVKSITFPVYRTGKADSAGNFVFTIVVGGNTRDAMMTSEKPDRVYHLSLNGEEYGLTASSNELRLVTVDLTQYGIVLKEGETMGFLDPADTIIPAMIPTAESVFATFYRQNVEACATFMRAYIGRTWAKDSGEEKQGLTQMILPFDFELERTWESKEAHDAEVAAAEAAEAEFQRKLAAVRAYYKGKKLSMLGDSITTYSSVSDNAAINSTLAPHASSYKPDALYPDHTRTYWGIVQTLLEMDLCVVNAWGGSRVYGSESKSWIDSMPERADQLHTDGGVRPDLIIVYMGVNDVRNSPFGNLPELLAAADDKEAAFASWYAGVLATADAAGGALTPGTTWKDWPSAYALGIKTIKETYPTAEIRCMTLVENYHSSGSHKDQVDAANAAIRAIAGYFGAGVIDQQQNGYITKANCILYGKDTGAESLHPNLRGHKMMARCIIEELYRYLPDA